MIGGWLYRAVKEGKREKEDIINEINYKFDNQFDYTKAGDQ